MIFLDVFFEGGDEETNLPFQKSHKNNTQQLCQVPENQREREREKETMESPPRKTTLWYWGSDLEPGMMYFPAK